jgi:hypothetical protein
MIGWVSTLASSLIACTFPADSFSNTVGLTPVTFSPLGMHLRAFSHFRWVRPTQTLPSWMNFGGKEEMPRMS